MRFDDTLTPVCPTRPVAAESTTLSDMFRRRVRRTPEASAWRVKANGRWLTTRWQDFDAASAGLATFLLGAGLALGDKITIVGNTGPQWAISDVAGQRAGLVTVGAYPTLTAEQVAYIIAHSDSRVALVDGVEQLEKLLSVREQCRKLERIVVWNEDGAQALIARHVSVTAFADAVQTPVNRRALARRSEAIDPSGCALIVYTSGTTGAPKGAMLTHDNVLSVLRHDIGVRFDARDHAMSFLPMAHVAERILGFYMRINQGLSTTFASSIPAILEEVQDIRPTLFGAVPRIFEKAYDRVQAEVAAASPAKRRVFAWANSVGRRAVQRWQRGLSLPPPLRLQHALADRLVFSKLREVFGGRVKFFVTGAAPIPREVLEFFWAAGFRIFEAYGMTEGTVISHINRPGATRLGSVGKPLPYAECKLAADGEILVRGTMVFAGYYKNDAASAEVIDDDGWLLTGDIGRIDDDGFLYIVDRKKHIIITAGGKNLSPANIENEIKIEDPILSQVHAHGDRRPYISALVTVSPLEALQWARSNGLAGDDAQAAALRLAVQTDPLARPPALVPILERVTQDPTVRRRIVQAVRRGNQRLAKVERVKRIVLLERELSVAQNELTPTMKVRRKTIETKFAAQFDRLYAEDDFGLRVEER